MMLQSQYLKPQDIMKHLQLGRDKVYELCRIPGFPAVKIGSSYRIDPEEYQKWLKRNVGKEISLL